MIVAGHGYNDPGAIGNGYNERDFIRKNIVDNVSKYLKDAGHTVGIYGKKARYVSGYSLWSKSR